MSEDPQLLRRYTTLAPLFRLLRSRVLTLLSPKSWDVRRDRGVMEVFNARRGCKTVRALGLSGVGETLRHWEGV